MKSENKIIAYLLETPLDFRYAFMLLYYRSTCALSAGILDFSLVESQELSRFYSGSFVSFVVIILIAAGCRPVNRVKLFVR
jgi:hypothetical protein